MPQGYGTTAKNTRPNPYRLRQDLGYVPARNASAGGSDGGGTSGGGVIISGGPSAPVITSSRVQVLIVPDPTYVLISDDLYKFIIFTNAGGCVITIPDDITMDWADALITIVPVVAFQQGALAGQITIVGSGAVINTLAIFKKKSFAQFAVLQLIWTVVNTWTLFGAQEPV